MSQDTFDRLSMDILSQIHNQIEQIPDKWGYVQVREIWSPKEETHVRPGHNWLLKFGTVAGSMRYVWRRSSRLVPHKFEEYRGMCLYNGDCVLVVDV